MMVRVYGQAAQPVLWQHVARRAARTLTESAEYHRFGDEAIMLITNLPAVGLL